MVFKFKNAFDTTQGAFRTDPKAADASFSATSSLGDGVNSRVSVRQFHVPVDEPPSLGGTDTAPNPVEYILVALGSCQEIPYRLYADALGIPLNGVSVKLKGSLDLRGFFNVDPNVRSGFTKIEAEVILDSPAPEHDLQRLKETVDRHCPVLDILRNPTPTELTLRTKSLSVAAE